MSNFQDQNEGPVFAFSKGDTPASADFIEISSPANPAQEKITALFARQVGINQLIYRAKELFLELAQSVDYTAAREIWTSVEMFVLAEDLKKHGPSGSRNSDSDALLLSTYWWMKDQYPGEPDHAVRSRAAVRVKAYSPKRFPSTLESVEKHLQRLLHKTKPQCD